MPNLPEFTQTELPDSYIDPLGQFEDILENAKSNGIINNPPVDEEETYNINSQRIRIQTIASRLWLLGYLPKKIPTHRIDKKLDEIKDAVVRFQGDANLIQDYWVGDKTWYALDELVSYESEFTYEKWFIDGNIKPKVINAIHRATQLRLWSLGIYPNKPTVNFKPLEKESLINFKSILKIFMVKPENFVVDFNYDTLKILFNQDCLTSSLIERKSSNKNNFLLNLTGGNKQDKQTLAQNFIISCAKIELWLLGYDVEIDGKNDFEISKESKLYIAISNYYQNFENYKKADADASAERITPEFFRGIVAANEISVSSDSEDISDEIAKTIKSEDEINKAWHFIEQKGMRLWDGLKRMWKWVKKIGRKVISFITENVYIAFFRYTSKAFKIVERGMSEVVKSLQIYLKGELFESNIYFHFSKDMDTTIYFPKGLSNDDGMAAIKKQNKQSKAFRVACNIIALIVKVFKGIATGIAGLFRLLYALLTGYKELKRLYLDFIALAS
jgi:hypothetical protein